jgi:hypothetical protein
MLAGGCAYKDVREFNLGMPRDKPAQTAEEAEADECIGGRIKQTKRAVDSRATGRLRNTTITTDACLY